MIPRGTCHHCFETECTCVDGIHTEFSYANPSFALPPGTALGDSFILGPMVARGGFGLIYLAYQSNLRRRVAVKEYFPGKLSERHEHQVVPLPGREESFGKYRDLFFDEGPTLGSINHKNVVAVYDFIAANNTGYLVMEYLTGATADKLVFPGNLAIATVLGISLSVLKGLGAIHSAGFVYLDLKPQNILVTKKGTIKIIDLGNTRRNNHDRALSPVAHSRGYAAPEQLKGTVPLTVQADIYGFGATLYTLVTGAPPPTPEERSSLKETGEDLAALFPLSSPPPGFEHMTMIIRKCMALDPMDRYEELEEIRQDMAGIIHDLKLKAVTDPMTLESTPSIREAENNLIILGADSTQPTVPGHSRSGILTSVVLLISALAALGANQLWEGWAPKLLLVSVLSLTALKLLHALLGRPPAPCDTGGWVLKGVKGEYAGCYLELDRPVVLGRDPDRCNLVFSSPHISRVHATLGMTEQGITVTDNGSSMGVRINHETISRGKRVELRHQDRLQLGGQVFIVLSRRQTQL